MATERQADQAVADDLRAENLRRANAVNAERFDEDVLSQVAGMRRELIKQAGQEPHTCRMGDSMIRRALAESYEARGFQKGLTRREWIEQGIAAAKAGKMHLFGMKVEYFGG